MERGEIYRALRRIVLDWKSRKSRKLTTSLPVEFTSSTLKYIRRAGGPKPSQPPSTELLLSCAHVEDEEQKLLPVLQLETKLFGRDYNGRLWRRYANEKSPMKPDDFRRVVVRALQEKWLTSLQLITILEKIDQLEATNTSIKRLRNRLMERLYPWNKAQQKQDFERFLIEVNDARDKILSRNTERSLQRIQKMPISQDSKARILATILPQSESNVGEDELS